MRLRDFFKTYLVLALVSFVAFMVVAIAQDTNPISNEAAISGGLTILSSLDFKTAGPMAIVLAVVQILMLVFRAPLSNFAGKWRLLIVCFLSLAGCAVAKALTLSPFTWNIFLVSLLADGATLAAIQVFVHQAWKQITEKNAAPAA